ncbi:hypothetical protein [Streptomyces aurantiacus]|uniref:hypothetical protein n=1 Tax=Streptomyces aurantiacus TaxID=47760 RepID=UPI0033DBC910
MKHRAVRRRSVVVGIGATAGVAAIGGIALTAQAGGKTGGSSSASATPSASSGTESGSSDQLSGGKMVSLPQLGLAAGYVVVEPGARGCTLKNSAGEYYGTAPAAIVDLKAAVRYVRANKGRVPGNVDRIFSAGTSAGGALSALLGASGDSPLYDEYLLTTYMRPSATTYLAALSEADRKTYLAKNTFLTWDGKKATFTWADFLTHVGARKKDARRSTSSRCPPTPPTR